MLRRKCVAQLNLLAPLLQPTLEEFKKSLSCRRHRPVCRSVDGDFPHNLGVDNSKHYETHAVGKGRHIGWRESNSKPGARDSQGCSDVLHDIDRSDSFFRRKGGSHLMHAAFVLAGCTTNSAAPNFEGRDWPQFGADVWQFDIGVAEAGPSSEASYLVSPQEFEDFQLSIEFWIEDETNSGIFVRCRAPEEIADINPDSCYEVNIWDNHPVQEFRTGSIVKHVIPAAEVHTLGKWNMLVVRAFGETIEVSVNNVVTATLHNAQRRSGFIALQYAGKNSLRFRDLTITTN